MRGLLGLHGGLRTVVGCLWGAWVGEWRGSGECVLHDAGVGMLLGARVGMYREESTEGSQGQGRVQPVTGPAQVVG